MGEYYDSLLLWFLLPPSHSPSFNLPAAIFLTLEKTPYHTMQDRSHIERKKWLSARDAVTHGPLAKRFKSLADSLPNLFTGAIEPTLGIVPLLIRGHQL
jgi:hypothetical protein